MDSPLGHHEGEDSGQELDAHDHEHNSHNAKKRKASSGKDEGLGPACYSCRKKKAKCSRKQPCSQCLRLDIECVYDECKAKPGVRTGAIESLTQRVATLENMFLGQGLLWQQMWKSLNPDGYSDSGCPPSSHNSTSVQNEVTGFKQTLSSLAAAHDEMPSTRRRGNSGDGAGMSPVIIHRGDADLPPDDLVDSLIEIYFDTVHPWIPMLHVRQFRASLSSPSQRRRVTTILHAIVSLCIRFSRDPRLEENPELRSTYASRSRQAVILQSMESFSVENLQALIICAFDTIGSGRGPSAWSIIGSMTRTVEQLRLSVEDEDHQHTSSSSSRTLIRRMAFLTPSASWLEVEERRRVFWNVFLMDRFCSITTGWNMSLTSADVKRRLPCEGALWEEGEPLKTPTPYFGVADQSYNHSNSILPAARLETEEEQASLGGFAYCVEATESLGLVTSFFLQHEIDVNNRHDVQRWLMRFKQLDFRLVQWKIFLPEKWREACVFNADNIMDPNLTLAHITHNTAVVLLHQGVAYPSPEWQSVPIRLPSSSSAETCLAAAVEVSIIAEKFLQNSRILTSPQFAFCLFICGRMLLAHAAYYNAPLAVSFDSIVGSLTEISGRWNGPHGTSGSNLASKFASRLLQTRQEGAESVDIREPALAEQGGMATRAKAAQRSDMQVHASVLPQYGSRIDPCTVMDHRQDGSPDSISLAFPPLPPAFQAYPNSANQTSAPSPAPDPSTVMMDQNTSYGYQGLSGADLDSLIECSFLPYQRVSMFSHSNPGNKGIT